MEEIQGILTLRTDHRVAIVATRFNSLIVNSLITGAMDAFIRCNGQKNNIQIYRVPGALEVPLICERLIYNKNKPYDAIVALGAIIQGATPHFDIVITESAKGIAQLSMSSGVPIMNGIITTHSIEQAIERAGTKAGNKGFDVMMAAIEIVSLYEQIEKL